jgi:hypothetical protein
MYKGLLIALTVLLTVLIVLVGMVIWFLVPPTPQKAVFVPPSVEALTESNVTVTVHQSAINDMLMAMFPIEGEGRLGKAPLSISYTWRLEKPHVELTDSGAVISAEADLRILGKSYHVAAQGKADIRYDSTTQELYMDVQDMAAHTDGKVLGIPLVGLHLSPTVIHVRILRQLPLFTQFKVKKPQDVREEVRFSVAGYRIRYEKQRAIVDLNVKFKELSQRVAGDDPKGHSQGK